MAKVSKRAPTDEAALAAAVDALATLGITADQRVRFRRTEGGRWLEGTAKSREPDGSLGLLDARGRRRSIPIDAVEVQVRGPRGGRVWAPLVDVAAAVEQLDLFR